MPSVVQADYHRGDVKNNHVSNLTVKPSVERSAEDKRKTPVQDENVDKHTSDLKIVLSLRLKSVGSSFTFGKVFNDNDHTYFIS